MLDWDWTGLNAHCEGDADRADVGAWQIEEEVIVRRGTTQQLQCHHAGTGRPRHL